MAHGNELLSKKYYWLKLDRHFFNNGRIKKLRKMAGGDTYTIIYLKMLLLSVEHNGLLIYEGIEDSFEKEIALKLDEEETNAAITIKFLLSQGILIEASGDYQFPDIVGMIGSESKSNIYKREKRLLQSKNNGGLEKFQPNSNQIPTFSNQIPTEKEIDIESSSSNKVITFNNLDMSDKEVKEKVVSQYEEDNGEELKKKLDTFLDKFGIVLDNYDTTITEMDFDLLTLHFDESEWLKENITSFKKVCELYSKIISGYYKEYKKKPKDNSYQILKDMLAEEIKKEKGENGNDTEESD